MATTTVQCSAVQYNAAQLSSQEPHQRGGGRQAIDMRRKNWARSCVCVCIRACRDAFWGAKGGALGCAVGAAVIYRGKAGGEGSLDTSADVEQLVWAGEALAGAMSNRCGEADEGVLGGSD